MVFDTYKCMAFEYYINLQISSEESTTVFICMDSIAIVTVGH